MGKLYFHYSTMNAGKSTMLLQAAHNYIERGMACVLLTAALDTRAGEGKISSRIGLSMPAHTFKDQDDLFTRLATDLEAERFACVFVDEAQFLSKEQVWQLARFVDEYGIPVMCYGLRVDFRGDLFPGSAALLALADEMREVREREGEGAHAGGARARTHAYVCAHVYMLPAGAHRMLRTTCCAPHAAHHMLRTTCCLQVRTICHCGKKAGMVVRRGPDGKALREGAQVQIGGNEVYVSLCR